MDKINTKNEIYAFKLTIFILEIIFFDQVCVISSCFNDSIVTIVQNFAVYYVEAKKLYLTLSLKQDEITQT